MRNKSLLSNANTPNDNRKLAALLSTNSMKILKIADDRAVGGKKDHLQQLYPLQ